MGFWLPITPRGIITLTSRYRMGGEHLVILILWVCKAALVYVCVQEPCRRPERLALEIIIQRYKERPTTLL